MREILFRAKRVDNNNWVEGYYLKTPVTTEFDCDGQYLDCGKGRHCIISDGVAHEIDPSTVGQYTGLKDKNGVKIFEGDIVRVKDYGNYFNVDVKYIQYGYLPFRWIDEKCAIGDIDHKECKVIGNTTDTPNLLT